MIGRELDELAALSSVAEREIDRTATPVLRATGIGRRGVLEPADIEVYDGEVVGIAGLLGSGRTELVRLLYGADRADTGQHRGQRRGRADDSPRHAIDHRIAFSSEDRRARRHHRRPDRRREHRARHAGPARRLRKIPRAEQDAVVPEYIEALGVRPADPTMLAGNLSGGNQQKVLLGRWLATAPELLILDEPTRGIDVGAKADIQRKVAELSASRDCRSSSSRPSWKRCSASRSASS